MEQAEEAAAKLKGLMAKLAGTWVSPLAEAKPRVVALAARLVPAAECLETVRENLASTAAQPDSAREQMLRAEAHPSFAQLHMAAAQRFVGAHGLIRWLKVYKVYKKYAYTVMPS
jgi:hypothetical protein